MVSAPSGFAAGDEEASAAAGKQFDHNAAQRPAPEIAAGPGSGAGPATQAARTAKPGLRAPIVVVEPRGVHPHTIGAGNKSVGGAAVIGLGMLAGMLGGLALAGTPGLMIGQIVGAGLGLVIAYSVKKIRNW